MSQYSYPDVSEITSTVQFPIAKRAILHTEMKYRNRTSDRYYLRMLNCTGYAFLYRRDLLCNWGILDKDDDLRAKVLYYKNFVDIQNRC